MRKRRLIVVACALAMIAVWVTWWMWASSLTAEERLLLGKWEYGPNSANPRPWCRFGPDRRHYIGVIQADGTVETIEWGGRWFIRNGAIVMDSEASDIRRAVRPILSGLGLPHATAERISINSITSDELVVVKPDGTIVMLTRVPH